MTALVGCLLGLVYSFVFVGNVMVSNGPVGCNLVFLYRGHHS